MNKIIYMKFSKLIIGLFLLIFGIAAGQTKKYIEHKIAPNETLTSISKQYKVSVNSILQLNPDAQNGIKLDKILLIPAQKTEINSVKKIQISPSIHEVKVKETKYSIAKLYGISVINLEKLNPLLLNDGLKVGQILQLKKVIAKNNSTLIEIINKNSNLVNHIIEAHETKYSISKKYGITIADLEAQNPEIVTNFPIGLKLSIKSTVKVDHPGKLKIIDGATANLKQSTNSIETKSTDYFPYKVKKGETIYSLSRLFSWSEEKLVAINPELKIGVVEGTIIKGSENHSIAVANSKSNYQDLAKTITKGTKKELVLFMPFNINKIESDTVKSISERLKKDKFLNMTLDFYSGALMAIDSAKSLNMNLNIRIYDSEETKNTSSASQIVSDVSFQDADVIIGPFYQSNVEKVAEIIADKNTFVISPLSKESGNAFKNLIQSMPTSDAIKNVMFDFMRSKEGNIIALIDPKKQSIKQYLDQNQNDIKYVNLNDKGSFVGDSIKKHFVKNKLNYVVMESEKTGVIFTTTTTMINAIKDYNVQLVILEPNETLDFDEIALTRLTKLKMTYASTTFENTSAEAKQFEKNYKKKNKIYPNQYAVRGFDLVFDTMVRLSQANSFQELIGQNATQQIENKFDYTARPAGGYSNNGISILYYDTDLTIKQAQ